jgi:hypothetical protein
VGSRNPDPPQPSRTRARKAPLSTGCRARLGRGALRRGTAALGPDGLHFHTGRTGREGEDFALHVPYEEITAVEADGPAGTLTVSTREQGELELHLGRMAVAWEELLAERRPDVLRDLGVGERSRVALVAVQDERLEEALGARIVLDDAAEVDALLVGAEHRADLARLAALARRVRPGGALWVVLAARGRGVSAEDVAAAARAAGLVAGGAVAIGDERIAVRVAKPS